MHLSLDLTKNVHSACYTDSVGDSRNAKGQRRLVKSQGYPFKMILEANMPLEQIDEALKHLSDSIRHARNVNRKAALYELVDALLDAKLEKQGKTDDNSNCVSA